MSAIYEIMKTMCSPNYRHTNFVVTYALGHMMYISSCAEAQSCREANVVIPWRAHCFYDSVYITYVITCARFELG